MIGFLFEFVIALLIAGLFFYLVKWAVTRFGLPEPIIVVVGVLILILFLYWAWGAFPTGAVPHGRVLR